MKRIATLAVILMLGLTASAHSVRYFTESQAVRTVRYLGAQNELMIYCGYDYEIETYVLINEVWMERINSAYYEIWVYGYDAYTGDEVYMPLDLGCVWLYSAGRMYNAAQYLRFHTTARTPSFTWYVPAYHPYTRMPHRAGYMRSYHYDIHCHGWMPPAYHHGPAPLPPYYMRQPGTPAPRPTNTWTPGMDRPIVTEPSTSGRTGTAGRVTTGGNATGNSTGTRTGSSNTGSSSRGTGTTATSSSSRGTSTGTSSSSRGTSTSTSSSSRGTSTGTSSSSRGTSTSTSSSSRGTSTSTSSSSSGTSTSTSSSSRGTSTGTSSSSSGTSTSTSSSSRSSATTGTTPTRSNTTATSSRSTSTTSATNSNGSSTSTSSRGTSTSSRGNNGSR